MPSLDRYCQGVIRYRVACQASADTSIILCKEKGLRLWRCSAAASATENLLSHFMQVRSKLPVAISSVVYLRNLLGTTLVLRVVSNLKTKPTPSSRLHSRQQKSRTRTPTLSLHRRRPHRQSCPTLLATTLPKTRSSTFGMFRGAGGQSKLRKRGRNS